MEESGKLFPLPRRNATECSQVKATRGRPSQNAGCNILMAVLLLNGIALVVIFGLLTLKLDVLAWNMVSDNSDPRQLILIAPQNGLEPLYRLAKASNPGVAHPREAVNAKVAEPVFVRVSSETDDELDRKAEKALERYRKNMLKQGVDIDSPDWKKRIAERR